MGCFLVQTIIFVPEKLLDFFSVQSLRKSRRIQKMASTHVPPSVADTGSEMENDLSLGPSSGKRKSPSCRHRGHTHQRPKGPQRPPLDYMQTNEYRKMPNKTGATRTRERRGSILTCSVCLQRILGLPSTANTSHRQPGCVLVDVPDYMDPDSLCEEAKIIKAPCGGGQPTPRRSTETMRAAYEKLKKLFE